MSGPGETWSVCTASVTESTGSQRKAFPLPCREGCGGVHQRTVLWLIQSHGHWWGYLKTILSDFILDKWKLISVSPYSMPTFQRRLRPQSIGSSFWYIPHTPEIYLALVFAFL